MSQNHPPLDNSNRKGIQTQASLREEVSNGEKLDEQSDERGIVLQVKTLRQARREYGLNLYQIRMARVRGELRRVQLNGEGRLYYLEDELKALSERVVQPWVRRVA